MDFIQSLGIDLDYILSEHFSYWKVDRLDA